MKKRTKCVNCGITANPKTKRCGPCQALHQRQEAAKESFPKRLQAWNNKREPRHEDNI